MLFWRFLCNLVDLEYFLDVWTWLFFCKCTWNEWRSWFNNPFCIRRWANPTCTLTEPPPSTPAWCRSAFPNFLHISYKLSICVLPYLPLLWSDWDTSLHATFLFHTLLKIDIEVFSCSLLTILSSVVLQVLFLSETRLVAGGFDCNPMLFEIDQNGVWYTTTFSVETCISIFEYSLYVVNK